MSETAGLSGRPSDTCATLRSLAPSVARIGTALVAIAVASPVGATGFFVNQQSVKGLGRVNAGVVAASEDASTVFFNPAGLVRLWDDGTGPDHSSQLVLGVQTIVPKSDLSNTGSVAATPGTLSTSLPYSGPDYSNPSSATPVPNIYYAHRLTGSDTVIGLGVSSPFGLKTEFSSDWFGRYDTIEASLTTLNITAVAGYRVNTILAVGGGVDIQYADSELIFAIPNPLVAGGPTAATDGRFATEGSTWTVGFNIGILLDVTSATSIGLHFRSGLDHGIDGDATTTGLTGPLAAANGVVGANARLKLPAMASVGLMHRHREDLKFFAQVDWFNWSTFNAIHISFADGRPDVTRQTNYRDAWGISVGADYMATNNWTVRGGVRFDQTPTVDGFRDTSFPDADRLWLGLGATYRLSKSSKLDIAINHVFFRDATVDVVRSFFDGSPLASNVRVQGTVGSTVNTISIGFSTAF